jgi:hypothetical protein
MSQAALSTKETGLKAISREMEYIIMGMVMSLKGLGRAIIGRV